VPTKYFCTFSMKPASAPNPCANSLYGPAKYITQRSKVEPSHSGCTSRVATPSYSIAPTAAIANATDPCDKSTLRIILGHEGMRSRRVVASLVNIYLQTLPRHRAIGNGTQDG
jgi:hypothetical protein